MFQRPSQGHNLTRIELKRNLEKHNEDLERKYL